MKERNSNIELYRIILMVIIISHHYVVNSGLIDMYDFGKITSNMIYLQLIGGGGKTAINCYLLITGYFMCRQEFKIKKLLKLYLQIKFYAIVIRGIFILAGYMTVTARDIIYIVFNVARVLRGGGFIGGYLALLIIFPFINILLRNLSKYQHLLLVSLLLLIQTVATTLFFNSYYENFPWYVTVYMIGAFIRMYPCKLFTNRKLFGFISIAILMLSALSIIVVDFLGSKFGFTRAYHLFDESDRLFAVMFAVSSFLYVLNINIGKRRWLNTIAESTFGVLLIHGNLVMANFLWRDIFKNVQFYHSPLLTLVIHSMASVIIVFVTASIIDRFRIMLIEKPLFGWIDSKADVLGRKYHNVIEKIKCKLNQLFI